jgi:hypothetical protein
MDIKTALVNALRMNPSPTPQLGGMAGQAQDALKIAPAYKDYAINMQSNGQNPVSIEEFVKGAR